MPKPHAAPNTDAPRSRTAPKKRKRSHGDSEQPFLVRKGSSLSADASDETMVDEEDDADEELLPAEAAAADGIGSTQPNTVNTSDTANKDDNLNNEPPVALTFQQQQEELLERIIAESLESPMALPANRVFPIQVGSQLFSLSGASLSSDAPSYFTQFFQDQLQGSTDTENIKPLFLDRDPDTFREISLHLQGYHVEPRDSCHFVRLFADAQFFSLPRLIQSLYKSEIFVKVGDQEFKISRDLFDGPGNSPNYFTLGFSAFFSTPDNVFPGLEQGSLLRPPSIKPPHLPTRSASIFRDLIHMLEGYHVHVRTPEHRRALLRDARYYHFKGLEQNLIAYQKVYNATRKQEEMIIRLEDIKTSGISLKVNRSEGAEGERESSEMFTSFESDIAYARPYLDSTPLNLVFELHDADMTLKSAADEDGITIRLGPKTQTQVLAVYNTIKTKITEATGVDSLELPQAWPPADIERDAHVRLNGNTLDWSRAARDGNDLTRLWAASLPADTPEMQAQQEQLWTVTRSQWRLVVRFVRQPTPAVDIRWRAVQVDAVNSEACWNAQRGFL